ncbi:TPA: hypothetical protein ACGCF2_000368 [Stenotrophomonas maltophilia]
MKNNTFTAEESVMIDLGLNPGLVENYSEVSLEPVSFEKEEGFSWGSRWIAVHEAHCHNDNRLMADGRVCCHKGQPDVQNLAQRLA